ncbi:cysteine synthase [Clostridium perfringens]|nr:cysteine synthase [Clostridium perfringens]
MIKMKYYNDIRDLIGNTPILKLNNISTKEGVNIYAKIEGTSPGGSCKDRVGIYMVEKAEKEGKLKSGSTIIEATAGNTGIGIALAAINKGYKIIFIVPNKFSIEKQKIMKALGAEIINTPKEEGMEGAINLANSLLSEIPNSLSLNQFKNEANPLAHYETTGRELYDGLDGQIDYFVAGAGSGGTISGVLKFLKENISEVKGILADPVGSIIGGGQCGTYKIEGIGNNFIPETMDMSLVDDVIKVNDEEAFDAVKLLAKKEGLIVGSSSGAAFAAVLKLAEKIEEGNIVTIFPDRGDRYFSTDLF